MIPFNPDNFPRVCPHGITETVDVRCTACKVQLGHVTIDSVDGTRLLTLEAADGHGNVVDVYLDEERATYLAWKLALTLAGVSTDVELTALLNQVEQHLLRKAG